MPISRKELIEVLEDVVNQACTCKEKDGTTYLDSMALSAYAEAMRILTELGRIEIADEYGRRVIGKWIDDETD